MEHACSCVWTTSVSSSLVCIWPLVTPFPCYSLVYLLHCQSPGLIWPLPPVAPPLSLFRDPAPILLRWHSPQRAQIPSGPVPALGGPSNVLHVLEVHFCGASLMTPATDESCGLSLFAGTSDGFVLDATSLPSFISTLPGVSSSAHPSLSCCWSFNHLLDWWTIGSVFWSFEHMPCVLFIKAPSGSMSWAMPPFHGHILRWCLHSRAVLLSIPQSGLPPWPCHAFIRVYCSLVFAFCRPSRREFAFSPQL